MIPNLTIIVASYVVIRLGTLCLRQFPAIEKHVIARGVVAMLAVLSIVVVSYMTVDTVSRSLPDESAPRYPSIR